MALAGGPFLQLELQGRAMLPRQAFREEFAEVVLSLGQPGRRRLIQKVAGLVQVHGYVEPVAVGQADDSLREGIAGDCAGQVPLQGLRPVFREGDLVLEKTGQFLGRLLVAFAFGRLQPAQGWQDVDRTSLPARQGKAQLALRLGEALFRGRLEPTTTGRHLRGAGGAE